MYVKYIVRLLHKWRLSTFLLFKIIRRGLGKYCSAKRECDYRHAWRKCLFILTITITTITTPSSSSRPRLHITITVIAFYKMYLFDILDLKTWSFNINIDVIYMTSIMERLPSTLSLSHRYHLYCSNDKQFIKWDRNLRVRNHIWIMLYTSIPQ